MAADLWNATATAFIAVVCVCEYEIKRLVNSPLSRRALSLYIYI